MSYRTQAEQILAGPPPVWEGAMGASLQYSHRAANYTQATALLAAHLCEVADKLQVEVSLISDRLLSLEARL